MPPIDSRLNDDVTYHVQLSWQRDGSNVMQHQVNGLLGVCRWPVLDGRPILKHLGSVLKALQRFIIISQQRNDEYDAVFHAQAGEVSGS